MARLDQAGLSSVAGSLDQSLAPSQHALFRELDGEGVILDLASGHYFGVDRVGARMWQLIGELRSLRRVHEQLLAEFDVAPDVLARDLLEFAGRLVRRGLASPV